MTNIIIGFAIWIPITLIFYTGYSFGKHHKSVTVPEPSKEDKDKNEALKAQYESMMRYDSDTAYKRKVK